MAEVARAGGGSVFGSVDQNAVLANLDVATDDGVDSTFFSSAEDLASSTPGLVGATAEDRRLFIMSGPAGLETE